MLKYSTIVVEGDSQGFDQVVNALLEKGWELYGDPILIIDKFRGEVRQQTMTLRPKPQPHVGVSIVGGKEKIEE